MATGFLEIYLLMVAGWTLVGVLIGAFVAKGRRKRGAILGAIVGVMLGSILATLTVFDAPAPSAPPPVTIE